MSFFENRVTLNNGAKMDIVGYGTWQSTGEDLERALDKALEIGYRHIDTATQYHNEVIIGRVLKRWFDCKHLKRDDLFLTTKLSRYSMKPDLVAACLNQSLADLQVDYVDLYLIHMPIGFLNNTYNENVKAKVDFNTDLLAIWKAMELQVDAGKAKAIGVSNFNQPQIQRILDNCRIKPSSLQIELHVYLQQKPLIQFCRENDIAVTSFSTLGSRGSLQTIFREKIPPNLIEDGTVVSIAKSYGKTAAQVLLKFMIQQQITVIPKSLNEERIRENLQLFDFKLSKEDMEALKKLDKGEDGRIMRMSEIFPGITDHPEYPQPR